MLQVTRRALRLGFSHVELAWVVPQRLRKTVASQRWQSTASMTIFWGQPVIPFLGGDVFWQWSSPWSSAYDHQHLTQNFVLFGKPSEDVLVARGMLVRLVPQVRRNGLKFGGLFQPQNCAAKAWQVDQRSSWAAEFCSQADLISWLKHVKTTFLDGIWMGVWTKPFVLDTPTKIIVLFMLFHCVKTPDCSLAFWGSSLNPLPKDLTQTQPWPPMIFIQAISGMFAITRTSVRAAESASSKYIEIRWCSPMIQNSEVTAVIA